MTKTASLIITIFISVILVNSASAQDPHFTQWHSSHQFLNPALTGISNNPRIGFNSRNQWNGSYVTNAISYDQRISPKAGYIGVMAINDIAGNVVTTNNFTVQYAYNFIVSEKLNIRVGANAGFFNRSVDFDKLRFGSSIDTNGGFINQINQDLPKGVRNSGLRPNFGLGTVLTYNNIFTGVAVHNLFEPSQSYTGNIKSRLIRRYSLHAGAFLPLNNANPKSVIIAPYLVFQRQQNSTLFMPGVNVNKGAFTAGVSRRVGFRNINIINATAGFSKGIIKVGYSFDYSRALTTPLVAHELSLAVYLGKPREGSDKGIPYYLRKMGF